MTDQTTNFEFFRALNIQSSIKAHVQISLFIFVKDTFEAFFEDTHLERIGLDHITVCIIGQ